MSSHSPNSPLQPSCWRRTLLVCCISGFRSQHQHLSHSSLVCKSRGNDRQCDAFPSLPLPLCHDPRSELPFSDAFVLLCEFCQQKKLFRCLLFSPFRVFFFFFLVILPNQTAFYKEPSNQSNGWQLSLRPPLISNRLGSKISTEHANQHHNQPVTEVGSKLILLSFIIMTYNYPQSHIYEYSLTFMISWFYCVFMTRSTSVFVSVGQGRAISRHASALTFSSQKVSF